MTVRSAAVTAADSEKPENVTAGAPDIMAEVGVALVTMQSLSSTSLNDPCGPVGSSPSTTTTSKGVPFSASLVSCAATGPIAFTVIEKVICCGEYTTPMCVRSTECSASALSVNDGWKLSIGEISSSFAAPRGL